MNLIEYKDGKAVKCIKCTRTIADGQPRYWHKGTKDYYCLACASVLRHESQETSLEDDCNVIANIYNYLAKATGAPPEALASMTATVFINQKKMH